MRWADGTFLNREPENEDTFNHFARESLPPIVSGVSHLFFLLCDCVLEGAEGKNHWRAGLINVRKGLVATGRATNLVDQPINWGWAKGNSK